ncbi:unnamed protein product [Ectocarpus sp. 12 AP-2014]
MNKSILLTRAKSANLTLKEKLAPYGFDLFECSLIEHKLLQFDAEILNEYSNIVITSSFAANNLPNNDGIYAWVVGENTKSILENKGYKIKFCAPDAITLKKELQKNTYIKAIYLSGDNITLEMPSNVRRVVFYNTFYKEFFRHFEIQRLSQGVDYILLYSENCAKTLLQLLLENGLLKYLESSTIVAISSKVARVVESYFKNIKDCNGSNQIIEFLEKINDKSR